MLQNIRDNVQGLMAKIIIGIIIVPFAAFGIDSFFRAGSSDVAEINGEPVTQTELDQAIFVKKRELAANESVDFSQLEDSKLRGPVLQDLIMRKVLLQEAEINDLRIAEAVLDGFILGNPSFQENGIFAKHLYENLLRNAGLTPRFYKNALREDSVLSQLSSGYARTGFATNKDMEIIARFSHQKRDFRFIKLPIADVTAEVQIKPEDVQAYYNEHSGEFMTKEEVIVEYIELRQSDLFKEVDEATLHSEYARELDGYEAGTQRHVAHILLEETEDRGSDQAQQQLSELRLRLTAGESFEELAKQNSEDVGSAEMGGDLGIMTQGMFPEAFEEAAAGLVQNEVSQPVKTEAGWHLIKVLSVAKVDPPSFEKRRAALKVQLQAIASQSHYVELVEQLADLTFTSEGLAEPAEQLGLSMGTSSAFSHEGGQGVFGNSRIIKAAFSEEVLVDGNNSEVIELATDHVLVLRVKEHLVPSPQAFEKVSGQIEAQLIKEKAQEVLQEKAEHLIAGLQAGTSIEKLAEQNGLEWQISLDTKRSTITVDPEVLQYAFSLPKPQDDDSHKSQFATTLGDRVVLQLLKAVDGDVSQLASAEKQALQQIIGRNRGGQSLQAWQSALLKSADIELRTGS